MKKYFIICFISFTNIIHAQKRVIDKDINVLKTGFCESSSAKCRIQQLNYLEVCEKQGDYFYSFQNYDSAFYYYSLPAKLNNHSTIFQSGSAWILRNKIISKAGDMKMSGFGSKPDTLSAFYYHYQFPLSKEDAGKLSLKYFKTVDGVFNFGRYDDSVGVSWQFELNPFMIFEPGTLDKIVLKILGISSSAKKINLIFIGGYSPSEDLSALYYNSLWYLKKRIKKRIKDATINVSVEYGGGHMNLSKIDLPALRIEFD